MATQLAGFNDRLAPALSEVIERALAIAELPGHCLPQRGGAAFAPAASGYRRFEHKLHWMPPGWPRRLPLTAEAKPDDAPVRILFVAGSTMAARFKIKGGIESLEAFAALRQRFPNLELVIRSDVEPEIRRRFENLPGLRIVSGLIPYEELEETLSGIGYLLVSGALPDVGFDARGHELRTSRGDHGLLRQPGICRRRPHRNDYSEPHAIFHHGIPRKGKYGALSKGRTRIL